MASRPTQDVSEYTDGSQSNDTPAQDAQGFSETLESRFVNRAKKTRNRTKAQLTKEEKSLLGKGGCLKGRIQVLTDGSIEYRRRERSRWIPAIYHDSIRAQLLAESPQGTYDIPRSRGPGVNDITSYHPDYKTNGPNREDRHEILFRYLEAGLSAPDYLPPFWYHHGRLVLDPDNHPVRKWNEIPLVLSSQFEGFDMETIRRLNTNITLRDFRARMPRFITKGSDPTPLDIYGLSTLGMRITRFRLIACCIAWTDREGGDIIKDYVDSILPPECKAMNSTEGFRDLTDYEIERTREANKGQFLSRAGKRALDPETRHARNEADKRKMVRLKAEHDLILANYHNKLPQQPTSKRRGRKRNRDKLVSSIMKDEEGYTSPSKRQKRTNYNSTISLQPADLGYLENFNNWHPSSGQQMIPDEPVGGNFADPTGEHFSNSENLGYDDYGYELEPAKASVAADGSSDRKKKRGLPVNNDSRDGRVPTYSLDFLQNQAPGSDVSFPQAELPIASGRVPINSSTQNVGPEIGSYAPAPEGFRTLSEALQDSPVVSFGLDFLDEAVPDFDFPVAEDEPSTSSSPYSESPEPENTEPEAIHSLPSRGPQRANGVMRPAPQPTAIQLLQNVPGFYTDVGFPLPAQRPGDFRFRAPSTRAEQESIQQALEYTRQDYRTWTGILEPSPTDPRQAYADQYDQMQEELCDNWMLGGETPQLFCVEPFTGSFDNWVAPQPGRLIPSILSELFP